MSERAGYIAVEARLGETSLSSILEDREDEKERCIDCIRHKARNPILHIIPTAKRRMIISQAITLLIIRNSNTSVETLSVRRSIKAVATIKPSTIARVQGRSNPKVEEK